MISARLGSLLSPCGVSLTRLQSSLDATGWSVAPPGGAFDAGLRRRAFPPDAASLLPGLLAATRTGLAPAGGQELACGSPHLSWTTSFWVRCPHCWAHETPARLTLRWRGGALSELRVALKRKQPTVRTDEGTIDLVRRLAQHHPDTTIAGILNRQGRLSARGQRFTGPMVASLRGYWEVLLSPAGPPSLPRANRSPSTKPPGSSVWCLPLFTVG